MKNSSSLQRLLVALTVSSGVAFGTALAAPGTLSQSPLFLSDAVEPNLIMAIDDSGSMDFETLTPTNDGAMWWSSSEQSFVNSDGSLRFSGGSRTVYLFPNGFNGGDTDGARRTFNQFEAIPPTGEHAFLRSPDYNLSYYNPRLTYEPWVDTSLRTFGDVTPTTAPWDPVFEPTTFTVDLTQNISNAFGAEWQFRVRAGMRNNAGNIATGDSDQHFSYFPATYYLVDNSLSPASLNGSPIDCANPVAASYPIYRANPTTLIGPDAIGPDGTCLVQYEIKPTTLIYPTGRTYADEIQNFANWFTYYRKRHQAMRGGIAQAFSQITGVRAGLFLFNNRGSNVTMASLTTDRDTFLEEVFFARGGGNGTPTRPVLKALGDQFERTGAGAPIIEACQKNFGVVFTDGFANTSGANVGGNVDGTDGAPFADTFSNTMGDIAMEYYKNLSVAGLADNLVPVPAACGGTPPPYLDCNDDPHMVTYAVTLNTTGRIFGVTHFDTEDAHTTPPTWLEPNIGFDPRMVDDLYHATVNGRGEMLNASTPTEIESQMNDVLTAILDTEGTASTVTFNTGLLNSESLVYQAKLDSEGWSGFLTASSIDPVTGDVDPTPVWDAADLIPAESSRQISTYDPGSGGIPFRTLGNLTMTQEADLGTDLPAGRSAQDLLDYLRGDRTYEGATGFRTRSTRTVLGDIVHSGPVLVAQPASDWPDTAPFPTGTAAYTDFAEGAASSRREAVYVGANDGMLHGFWADEGETGSGAEFMAYVPHALFSATSGEGLHELAQQDYNHEYYVDLTPVVTDAYTKVTDGGAAGWHTVLVGGLRGGGAGYFALDVTNPAAMRESDADTFVMWEFTSDDDALLGSTFSEPTIALMNNGRWAAVFGNGYNNAGTGQAALFIVYLDGGLDGTWTEGANNDYIKIVLPASASTNGLSSPQLADTDNDRVPDRIYAGDLAGRMWAFDVSDSNASQWDVDYKNAGTSVPLFTATNTAGQLQPITSRPVLARCPYDSSVSPDIMVLFGTGQYLVEGDKSSTETQTFYGIWDRGTDELVRSQLLTQMANDPTLSYDTNLVRVPTENTFDAATQFGWKMDLPDSGERVVSNPLARGDILFFNTIVPSASDPCVIGGGGWLMSVRICDGARPEAPVFDLNRDNVITNGDVVSDLSATDADGNPLTYPPGGEKFNPAEGLPWQSSILGDRQYTPGSTGSIETRAIDVGNSTLDGRLSWEQLINE